MGWIALTFATTIMAPWWWILITVPEVWLLILSQQQTLFFPQHFDLEALFLKKKYIPSYLLIYEQQIRNKQTSSSEGIQVWLGLLTSDFNKIAVHRYIIYYVTVLLPVNTRWLNFNKVDDVIGHNKPICEQMDKLRWHHTEYATLYDMHRLWWQTFTRVIRGGAHVSWMRISYSITPNLIIGRVRRQQYSQR